MSIQATVTPLSMPMYLAYRLLLQVPLSFISDWLLLPLANLISRTAGEWLLLSVGAAPLAPLLALAHKKV